MEDQTLTNMDVVVNLFEMLAAGTNVGGTTDPQVIKSSSRVLHMQL